MKAAENGIRNAELLKHVRFCGKYLALIPDLLSITSFDETYLHRAIKAITCKYSGTTFTEAQ